MVETGLDTSTGGRIKTIKNYVKDDDFFCLTYGDGVADINIEESINFHKKHDKLATLTAINPIERFGVLEIDKEETALSFQEKPANSEIFINGVFFVLSPKIIDYISNENSFFEKELRKN